MNKLIIFDLDGVLIDSKNIHFNALNIALEKIDKKYVISKEEQYKTYEGLPTKIKLKLLSQYKNLSTEYYDQIIIDKQQITKTLIKELKIDKELVDIFKYIKSFGIKIAVASNSIKETIIQCLDNLEIYNFVDYIASNEDVNFAKPHPEIYWNVISHFGLLVEDVVIFEDSILGKLAAQDSKAKLIEVKNRLDLSFNKINEAIEYLKSSKSGWSDKSLNILIPMAGAGSRFFDAGYDFPKPLIDVDGMPMIQAVVNNLSINARYIYIVQKEHYEKYSLEYLLNIITPGCVVVQVNGVTDGAARTCLYASDFINNDNPLLIANSDQILEWDSREFLYDLYTKNADGGIATFKSSHPKWSYAKINDDGLVLEVAEKNPISDNATVGIYYWKHGADFIKYANQMINKNIRTNNEFYVCPIFNEAIQDQKKIYALPVEEMWGVGTPEDLNYYLYNRNKSD
jgi:beta-phosphoglucomutase-like phosphatase (HAD superfamily)/dTDP-glucose pyrophosphorylase